MNTNKIFNTGIYIRLSREDEKQKESSSIESQRDYLLSYIKEKGYHYVDAYIDDGYTGTNFERPAFKKLIRDIEIGRINTVIVKDLSRLGRNNSKVSYYLDEYFPIYKIRFIAVNNDYDSYVENASQEYAWLTNGMNESYCLDISKKVRSALKVRKEKGYFTGWKAPYGYKKSEENVHQLVIDKEVSPIVQRIFNMAYQGKSASQIADILSLERIPNPSHYGNLNRKMKSPTYSLWCARTISEMLENETYIGNLTQGRRKKINYKVKKERRVPKEEWIIVKNTHEAIIDENIFYTVQNLYKKNRKIKHKNNKLLSGFIFCKECGHKIGITRSRDGKRFYLGCTYYRKYSKFGVCTPHTMNYQKLEELVLKALEEICKKQVDDKKITNVIKNKNHIQNKYEELKKQIEIEKKHIETSNKVIDHAYIDMGKGYISLERYKSIARELQQEIDSHKNTLALLGNELAMYRNRKKQAHPDYIKRLREFMRFQNPSRALLANIIDRIYISEDKKIEIYFKFRPIYKENVIE